MTNLDNLSNDQNLTDVTSQWKHWSTDELPKLCGISEKLRSVIYQSMQSHEISRLIEDFISETGIKPAAEGPMIMARPSAIKRVGCTAQWLCPELGTRIGLGLESALIRRVVDRFLGNQRTAAEEHLPTTPVEWGFWTVLASRFTECANKSGMLPRLLLDRVGPDSFDTNGLGNCQTVSWELLYKDESIGIARIWIPDSIINYLAINDLAQSQAVVKSKVIAEIDELIVRGRVQAGVIELPGGLARLRPRLVLPWVDAPIQGTVPNLDGPVVCRMGTGENRWSFVARLKPESQGRKIDVIQKPKKTSTTGPRGAIMASDATGAATPDLPVTLTVELGRLTLSLSKLADLKPGEVLSLARNTREPVELTSGDRLVARGEIVQIDQDLGVRILQVLI